MPLAARQGFALQRDLCVSPYDATYMAVARNANREFRTADDRLMRTVGEELPWVRWLSETCDDEDQPPTCPPAFSTISFANASIGAT